jgi:mannan endo-1,4-beta-mannosidase
MYLDRVADFFASCRGEHGELIPLIFRPFHEHTGSWFWWGAAHASDEEFIALWRFTVDYLRKERGFSHLLFAFSPGAGPVTAGRPEK